MLGNGKIAVVMEKFAEGVANMEYNEHASSA